MKEQKNYHPSRWKYIGNSDVGIITVITEEDETSIVLDVSILFYLIKQVLVTPVE